MLDNATRDNNSCVGSYVSSSGCIVWQKDNVCIILTKSAHSYVSAVESSNFIMQQTTNFAISGLIFDKNKKCYFMRIVCQQTILVKYHALFVSFEKAATF